MRLSGVVALAVVAALTGVACARGPGVVRLVDGRLVVGEYVEPEAYAAFLRGAILEETGDLRGALAAYQEAARHDGNDPEIWTRIAAVECRANPRSPAAEAALSRALGIDGDYAGAWGVSASCALERGTTAVDAARRATDADPLADDLQVVRARGERGPAGDRAARERLVALTLIHGGRAAAWQALAAWATSKNEPALYARALSELARRGLGNRAELIAAATTLAGEAEAWAARMLAGALAEAKVVEGAPGALSERAPLVSRMAVDEAILAGDTERARLRATRTHVGLEETAARALLLGQGAMARELAGEVAGADPHAVGARLVLAVLAADAGDRVALRSALLGVSPSDTKASAAAAMAFALLAARSLSPDEARSVVLAIPREPLLLGDALLTSIAAELAARGVLADAELPLDAAVELAVRRGVRPPEAALADAPMLDARHRILALAVAKPEAPPTRRLAARMEHRRHDPLVAVALARLDGSPGTAARLLAMNPGDPLVVDVALDLARRHDDAPTAARARAALRAIARTPAERALFE